MPSRAPGALRAALRHLLKILFTRARAGRGLSKPELLYPLSVHRDPPPPGFTQADVDRCIGILQQLVDCRSLAVELLKFEREVTNEPELQLTMEQLDGCRLLADAMTAAWPRFV